MWLSPGRRQETSFFTISPSIHFFLPSAHILYEPFFKYWTRWGSWDSHSENHRDWDRNIYTETEGHSGEHKVKVRIRYLHRFQLARGDEDHRNSGGKPSNILKRDFNTSCLLRITMTFCSSERQGRIGKGLLVYPCALTEKFRPSYVKKLQALPRHNSPHLHNTLSPALACQHKDRCGDWAGSPLHPKKQVTMSGRYKS